MGEAARLPADRAAHPRGSQEGKGAQQPAAPAQETGGAERIHRSPALSVAEESCGSFVRLGPHQRSAGAPRATPACLRYTDADQAAVPGFVPGGKPPARSSVGRQGEGGSLKRALGLSSWPGPSRNPSLRPNAPIGSAGFGLDASREFTRLRTRRSFHEGLPEPCDPSRGF